VCETPGPTLDRRRLLTGAAATAATAGLGVLGAGAPAQALIPRPLRLLVFSKTAGFRHASIPLGIETIRRLGEPLLWTTDATEDETVFRTRTLRRYDIVVFLNTTGEVMDARGRAALERWVREGGGWVGIHSAADTEYEWGFYGRLLAGAWFKCHPLEQPGTIVREDAKHLATRGLPERWNIPIEEFYSFKRNPRSRTRVLLTIDESSYQQDPNTSDLPSQQYPDGYEPVSGVMGDHPMSWTHRVGDGRSFYTALGHELNMYVDDHYRRHLRGGILSVARRNR
jgi:type 1 glutamine amidotransferase